MSVKIPAKVAPVPPENKSGMPWTPVEFVGLSALPYVEESATGRGRIAWSFRAEGMVAPGSGSEGRGLMTTPTSAPALPAGSVLLWPPQGAGDFADLAWVIAEALGNGPGVRGLDVSRRGDGLYARVWTTGPEYVAVGGRGVRVGGVRAGPGVRHHLGRGGWREGVGVVGRSRSRSG